MNLAVRIYEVTRNMPKDEVFGLRAQIRGCATSVPSNLAEGCGRNSSQEMIRFTNIANGSLLELETRMEIAFRTGMLPEMPDLFEEIKVVGRKLVRLRISLERMRNEKSGPTDPLSDD